jgi:hypothetical protein
VETILKYGKAKVEKYCRNDLGVYLGVSTDSAAITVFIGDDGTIRVYDKTDQTYTDREWFPDIWEY